MCYYGDFMYRFYHQMHQSRSIQDTVYLLCYHSDFCSSKFFYSYRESLNESVKLKFEYKNEKFKFKLILSGTSKSEFVCFKKHTLPQVMYARLHVISHSFIFHEKFTIGINFLQ